MLFLSLKRRQAGDDGWWRARQHPRPVLGHCCTTLGHSVRQCVFCVSPSVRLWLWWYPTGQALEVVAYFISHYNHFTSKCIRMYVCLHVGADMLFACVCVFVHALTHTHTQKNVCLFVVKVELINLGAQCQCREKKMQHNNNSTLTASQPYS